ncbi:hypothetical protein D3C86_1516670 [compost metagenome]
MRLSNPRTLWLSDDGDSPSLAAARVKLRSRATERNASRSLKSSRGMRVSGRSGGSRGLQRIAWMRHGERCSRFARAEQGGGFHGAKSRHALALRPALCGRMHLSALFIN